MKNKYGAKKTIGSDGRKYDSKLEAKRAYELQMMERAGDIIDLKFQQQFPLEVNGHLVCKYIADFTYTTEEGLVVEDAKGAVTRDFRIKAKLFKALYGFDITIYPPKKKKRKAKN